MPLSSTLSFTTRTESLTKRKTYEDQALVQAVWEAAVECLTEEEYDLFYAYFEQGVSQTSLAEDLDMSDRSVRYKFSSIREKVRKHVINKKWEL